MELYQLEQLVMIAEAGTISKAAEKLLISQPALTRSVQKLEDELGLKLFDRKKNKVTLNDNGEMAVQYARDVLKNAGDMVEKLRAYDRSKHTIEIGSCAPAPVWGLSYAFDILFPDMKIGNELHSSDEILIKGLEEHRYTMAVLMHELTDPRFICEKMFTEELYLSVPPAHPLALASHITFEDLNGESVLLLSRIGFWNELCLKQLPDSHLLIQEDASVFNELTKASALPCFSTNITIQRLQAKENRVYVPITDEAAKVTYYMVYRQKDKERFSTLKYAVDHIDWPAALSEYYASR